MNYGVSNYTQWPKQLNASLEVVDPEVADIIELEKNRQWKVLFALIFIFFSLLRFCDSIVSMDVS